VWLGQPNARDATAASCADEDHPTIRLGREQARAAEATRHDAIAAVRQQHVQLDGSVVAHGIRELAGGTSRRRSGRLAR
jgi:hypothetical protein